MNHLVAGLLALALTTTAAGCTVAVGITNSPSSLNTPTGQDR